MDLITAVNAALAAKNIRDVGSKVVAGVKKKKTKDLDLTDSYDPEDINNEEKEPTWTEPTASPSGSNRTSPTAPFVQTAAEKEELDNVMLGATTGGEELMNRPSRNQDAEDAMPNLMDDFDFGKGGVPDGVSKGDLAPRPSMESYFGITKKSNPYGDFGGERYDAAPTFEAPNPNFAGALTGDADRQGAAPLDETTTASRAIPVETYDTLFKKTHGGSFNPKSRVDREKMAVIQGMIDEDKSLLKLSPTQFALKVYGRK